MLIEQPLYLQKTNKRNVTHFELKDLVTIVTATEWSNPVASTTY